MKIKTSNILLLGGFAAIAYYFIFMRQSAAISDPGGVGGAGGLTGSSGSIGGPFVSSGGGGNIYLPGIPIAATPVAQAALMTILSGAGEVRNIGAFAPSLTLAPVYGPSIPSPGVTLGTRQPQVTASQMTALFGTQPLKIAPNSTAGSPLK